jgi:hypothetical protein
MQNTETEKNNPLADFEQIRILAEEQGLSEGFFEKAKPHLETVTALLKINYIQAALFALLMERSGEEDASLAGIAKALNCGKIQAMQYLDDLETLEKKRLIICEDSFTISSFSRHQSTGNQSYVVPADVINAIRAGKEYRYTIYRNLDPEDFYYAADSILNTFRKGKKNLVQFRSEISYLYGGNREIAFVKSLKNFQFDFSKQMILLALCAALVADDESALSLSDIRPFMGKREKFAGREFAAGDHVLFTAGLLEHACDNGLADTEKYCLTDKAKETFLADVNLRDQKKIRGSNIISAKAIAEKELFYPNKLCRQIGDLTDLLGEEKFSCIKQRLKDQNMRTGFACLFSGPPGTGKTETAYQIARRTGRDIMLVNIADTKSMWFGESEKRIKALFDRYQGIVKNAPLAPILLFNEADGILGKRQELGDSRRGPGQTENTIQNIILQEMENLQGGILIATTNMTNNLDKAFERRFLYKVEFEKPDHKAKTAIWQSILSDLTGEDAETLASRFDFSGGQIENVARKQTIGNILQGSPLSLEGIFALCREELFETDKIAKIGFCASSRCGA